MADEITRKEFLQAGVATLLTASVAACDSDDSGDDENAEESGGGDCTSPTANIATNHGHSVSISAADVNAAAAKDYTLTGGGHEHTISLSADQMTMIAAGENVMVTSSSTNGHTHGVTVSC